MGFICAFDGVHYSGVKPVLVPTEFRKVEYRYYSENFDRRTKQKEKVFERSAQGFEIVKEVNVSPSNFEEYKTQYVPKFLESKIVDVTVPKKIVEKDYSKFSEEDE